MNKIKVYIINLKNDFIKKNKCINELNKYNINYEFIQAIDGSKLKPEYVNPNISWFEPTWHYHMTMGEIGCAYSHFSIWNKIIKEGIDRVIILEDDFIVNDPNICEKILELNIENCDFIYLGRKKFSNDEIYDTNNKNLVIPTFSYWTIGYIITFSGAKKLVNNYFFNNMIPIDEYLGYMTSDKCLNELQESLLLPFKKYKDENKLKAFAFEPPLIKPRQNAFESSLTFHSKPVNRYNDKILLLTVATDNNDCLQRYIFTCNRYGFNPIVLGLDEEWSGGDMLNGIGGGQKIILLKKYLDKITDDKLIIFTDSYDVVANDNLMFLLLKYNELYKNKIVFASEPFCWPDESLKEKYPTALYKNKYLNSGLFMGMSNDVKKMLSDCDIKPTDDDQLFYTNKYLDSLNNSKGICIDYKNRLFMCMNGQQHRIRISDKQYIYDNISKERPVFIHANGDLDIKFLFNHFTNICYSFWNPTYGYKNYLKIMPNKTVIIVYNEYLKNNVSIDYLININYNPDLISLIYITENTDERLKTHFKNHIIIDKNEDKYYEKYIYNYIYNIININKIDYIFYLNSYVTLTNKNTLKELIRENRSIIAPLLDSIESDQSNFKYYGENPSHEKNEEGLYEKICNRKIKGCWNVKKISNCYLIKNGIFTPENFPLNNFNENNNMVCNNILKNYNMLHLININKYGNINKEYYIKNDKYKKIGLFDFKDNHLWEKKYIHASFLNNFNMKEVGTYIYKFQLFTSEFCNELMNICNKKNSWSKGGEVYYDNRISNKELHPTQDIHLKDMGLGDMWKYVMDTYIYKIVWDKFSYHTKNTNINFVVKYSMEGQKDLKPHHDSSTYTINVCLNNDYEGGGCNFIMQEKIINNKDIGSVILHPGKLTHYHEGLPITKGNRYILISFVE